MQPLRPTAKVGIVCGGFIVATGLAWLAVVASQHFTPDSSDGASSGMQAFGDLLLAISVFGVLALGPLSLGFYWLRSVDGVWPIVARGTVLYAMTGPLAVAVSSCFREASGNLALLTDARIGIMPLSALFLLTGGLFAPATRWRLLLGGAALLDGVMFGGVVLVHFVLPHFGV